MSKVYMDVFKAFSVISMELCNTFTSLKCELMSLCPDKKVVHSISDSNRRKVSMNSTRKIPVNCPHCGHSVPISDIGWWYIFKDLDSLGKAAIGCPSCERLFLIREEDETGPFVTK